MVAKILFTLVYAYMIIAPVSNIQYQNTSFRSGIRTYTPKEIKEFSGFGQKQIHTMTNLFRDDLDWNAVTKYCAKNFKDTQKVNTLSLACSDGSEAYSFAISIIEFLPEKLRSKFLPIMASDVDKEMIKAAHTGRLNIFPLEFLTTEQQYDITLDNYFKNKGASVMIKGDETSESDTISSYEAVQILKDSIIFKQADILSELINIKDEGNSVILCRNVFPYLNDNYIDEIIQTAKRNLKDGSLFIIGYFDNVKKMEDKLLENGFFKPLINCCNVFQRGTDKKLRSTLYSGYLI